MRPGAFPNRGYSANPFTNPDYREADQPVASQKKGGTGSSYQPNAGTYYLKIVGNGDWKVVVKKVKIIEDPASPSVSNPPSPTPTKTDSVGAATPTPIPTPSASSPPASQVLTNEQRDAVVLIEGDKGVGTGFICRILDGLYVVTNQHVLSGNTKVKIMSLNKKIIPTTNLKCAVDHDIAAYRLQDQNFPALELESSVEAKVKAGDPVVAVGNSQGGGVLLETPGFVKGLGPDRIEVDNPIFGGNSGGPIIQTATGKVVGVITYVRKVNKSDSLS
jgi:S1-C subfamily serine protease